MSNKVSAVQQALTYVDAYKSMLLDYPDVLNVEQLAQILGVSTKTTYQLIREKKIQTLKVGKALRIPKVFVFKYLQII